MGLQVWRGRVSGNHLDEVTVLAKLMEMQIWLLPVYTHRKGRGLNKRQMDSTSTSVWEIVAPQPLP